MWTLQGEVAVHSDLTGFTWKDRPICGNAVAMIVPSRFSMKKAPATRMAMDVDFAGGSGRSFRSDGIDVEGPAHLRQCRGDDCAVQIFHEKSACNQDGDGCGLCRGKWPFIHILRNRSNRERKCYLAAESPPKQTAENEFNIYFFLPRRSFDRPSPLFIVVCSVRWHTRSEQNSLKFVMEEIMAEKKIIAVLGATGAQGGGMVRAILNDPNGGFAARAITRDVNGAKAKELAKLGAEVVAADVDDADSLKKAFDGAYG